MCLSESIWNAKHKFYTYRQADFESNSTHIRNVKNLYEIVEHLGVSLFGDDSLLKHEMELKKTTNKIAPTLEECKVAAKKRGLALHALKTSKHRGICKMLRERFMLKDDKYPADLEEAHEMLSQFIIGNNIPEVKGGSILLVKPTSRSKTEQLTEPSIYKSVRKDWCQEKMVQATMSSATAAISAGIIPLNVPIWSRTIKI